MRTNMPTLGTLLQTNNQINYGMLWKDVEALFFITLFSFSYHFRRNWIFSFLKEFWKNAGSKNALNFGFN